MFVSASDQPMHITVQYGESREEALNEPYLGVDPVTILPHGTAYGPKSAFRFAKVRFVGGGPTMRFQSIALDDIYYPVKYQGSFESSDPLLNQIWEVGAYTDHLCMQEDIWDATKRDRARWAGDLDVSGRGIDDVFDDHFLMQDTMTNLLPAAPVKEHVNDISGYSAWWINVLTQYYLHTGSKKYLQSVHERLVQLLNYMDTDVDAKNLFADTTKTWDFVDWSPELNGNTAEAKRATQFEFYLAYRDAAFLLRQLGDTANADHFEQRATLLKEASQKYLLDSSNNTFGPRWQTNAAADVYRRGRSIAVCAYLEQCAFQCGEHKVHGAGDDAVLQLLHHLRDGADRSSAGSACVDSPILGRDDCRGSDKFLGSLLPQLAER